MSRGQWGPGWALERGSVVRPVLWGRPSGDCWGWTRLAFPEPHFLHFQNSFV